MTLSPKAALQRFGYRLSFSRLSFCFGSSDATVALGGEGFSNSAATTSSNFPEEMRRLHLDKLLAFDRQLCRAAQNFFTVSEKSKQYKRYIFRSIKKAVVGTSDRSLVMIGSSGTGLAGTSSDIDLVLLTSSDPVIRIQTSKILCKPFAFRKYMSELTRRIKLSCQNDFAWDATQILDRARVPILVLKTRQDLKVEIQLNTENSLRNTLFLRTIVKKDPRVAVMIFWAKEWLKALRLKNSKQGLFSSYHVAMLVTHFLQNRVINFSEDDSSGVICPNAPIEGVISRLTSEEPTLRAINRNLEPTVIELILHFLSYYSDLDLHEVVIPAAECSVKKREEIEKDELLWIKDPFSSVTVCNVKRGADRFAEAISFTKAAMIAGKGLSWPIEFW